MSSDGHDFYTKLNSCLKPPVPPDTVVPEAMGLEIPDAPLPPPPAHEMTSSAAAAEPLFVTSKRKPPFEAEMSFDLRASQLQQQRHRLQPIDRPHPSQLCDVTGLPPSQLDDITSALKQARATFILLLQYNALFYLSVLILRLRLTKNVLISSQKSNTIMVRVRTAIIRGCC